MKKVLVPLALPLGLARADFFEAKAVIGGRECNIHFLVFNLPHCEGVFVKACLAETFDAFCDGRGAAFELFGGITNSFIYDNTKPRVACINFLRDHIEWLVIEEQRTWFITTSAYRVLKEGAVQQ